jgi:type IV pilus assembly protein PilO
MTNVGAVSGNEDGAAGGLTLFGFTFTSKILGILIGVAGIGLAAYATTSFVMPLWEQVQSGQKDIDTKKTALTALEQKVAGKGNIVQKIEEANSQNLFVLSLLPSVDNIDTLIRDIQEQIPKTITFTSLGFSYDLEGSLRVFQPKEAVKGPQYNTYSFTIGFDGKFEDVLTTIQKIERLKPLLVIKDLKLTKKTLPSDKFKFNRPIAAGKEKDILESFPPLIGADFNLEAFVPLTEAELKAAAAAAVPKK